MFSSGRESVRIQCSNLLPKPLIPLSLHNFNNYPYHSTRINILHVLGYLYLLIRGIFSVIKSCKDTPLVNCHNSMLTIEQCVTRLKVTSVGQKINTLVVLVTTAQFSFFIWMQLLFLYHFCPISCRKHANMSEPSRVEVCQRDVGNNLLICNDLEDFSILYNHKFYSLSCMNCDNINWWGN